ncbi:hypothetical protein [Streptomyces sp. NPDC059176]|uniref:hypothetical protein n=1 Tax=Streptomyces sp. NPDC059176 TaxID=3346758 RepID=UPI003676D2F8
MPEIDTTQTTAVWRAEECSDEYMDNCACIVATGEGNRIQYIADAETAELATQIVTEHNAIALAREFRIPMTNELGGYGEVVVERGDTKWAVTDGATTGKQAWVNGAWRYITDVGRVAVFTLSLQEALALGHEVAAIESARTDALVRTWRCAQGATA